ncbi:peptidase family M48-domain-containing protein [Roridomyces roridus]|uniref:Peptidase family M48-domain-containing protein n=1 Tax=Roridomyces roridus TaxID=1738132 RepID=A0AAD7BZV0_9AGAR|nr:peptidase family M48-domain-containing protein [Roridomyces roridus]
MYQRSSTVLRRCLLPRSSQLQIPSIRPRFYSSGPISRPPRTDRPTGTYIGVTIGLLLGGYYVTHLENAPETGRRRFMTISQEEEELIGKQALEDALREFQGRVLPFEHPLTQQVRRITRRIISSSNLGHLEGESPLNGEDVIDFWSVPAFGNAEIPRSPTMHPDKEWVVLVVNDRNFVNAFAAPGLVCVSTGIMPVARNEEGLAAIIGHEIGHVTMRHTAERVSTSKLFLPLTGLLFLMGIDFYVSSMLTEYLYNLPHSRKLETEADIVGIKLMSRACYDPAAAPRVFQDLNKLEKTSVPKFLNTHPPTPERIAHLKTLLPSSYEIYNANPECARLEEMRKRGYIGRMRMNID